MRILLLAPQPFFQQRGTPIAVRMLAEHLGSQGHGIDLLTYHEGEDIEIPGCRVHRIAAHPRLCGIRPGFSWKKAVCDLLMLQEAFRLASQTRYDLVHAVEESAFIALLLRWRFGIPYVYDMDSSLAQQLIEGCRPLAVLSFAFRLAEKVAIRGSEGALVVCKALQELVTAAAPDKPVCRLEDVSLLPLSFDQQGDPPAFPPDIHRPVIMYVGNFERYQGIDLLLDSFRWVLERRADAQLVLIGGSPDHIDRYRNRTRELGIESSVHFLGPRPLEQLGGFLQKADVVVSPRISGQNTPMKLYSYLDSGRPVVATSLPTHTQVLDDRIACLVQPNPEDMAAGLVRMLENERAAMELARRARQRVGEEFSIEAFRAKLSRFYSEIESRVISVDKADATLIPHEAKWDQL